MGSLLEVMQRCKLIPVAKKGYSINIKPENKGKFTEKAKGQEWVFKNLPEKY